MATPPSREGEQRRWQSRPLLSLAVRGLVLILPQTCALAVNVVIGRLVGPPSGPAIVVWVVLILAVSSTVLVLVYGLTRRLLPLAVLLDVSLAFPDKAPSRVAVARRRPNLKDLQAQLAEAHALGQTGAPVERAELIVTLAISLSAGHQVFRVPLTGHAPDGIAVVRPGIVAGGLDLSGNIFVNSNDGTIERIDTLHGNRVSVVATGGVRGDYIAVGTDGCMYATQNAKLDRLEPCVFSPSNQV